MKCLTIHQPYPTLILTPQSRLPNGYFHKRVENRSQNFNHVGPLLIHAGKSTEFLKPADEQALGQMYYGALRGVVRVVGCWRAMAKGPSGLFTFPRAAIDAAPWLPKHAHTEGPFCMVLADARVFKEPIPYRGQQGLFNVEEDVVAEAIKEAEYVECGTV